MESDRHLPASGCGAGDDALIEAGIADATTSVDLKKPKLQEVLDAVEALPGMRALLLRAELQPILRNLTVLDWVLRADVAHRFTTSRPWIGETEFIDCIWDRWLGPASQLELLAKWLDSEPEAPVAQWYKRFSGLTVCGEGELIKIFLLPAQAPKGQHV
jgi:hypothetical protein